MFCDIDGIFHAPDVPFFWGRGNVWLALNIDENGDVTEVCVGTNKKNDRQYYYDRPRRTGDYHGQAPVLWCAFALTEK